MSDATPNYNELEMQQQAKKYFEDGLNNPNHEKLSISLLLTGYRTDTEKSEVRAMLGGNLFEVAQLLMVAMDEVVSKQPELAGYFAAEVLSRAVKGGLAALQGIQLKEGEDPIDAVTSLLERAKNNNNPPPTKH